MDPFLLAVEIDGSNDHDNHHQYQSLCTGVAELVIPECIAVDFHDNGCICICGIAEIHDVNSGENFEYGDKLNNDQVKGRWRNQRE